MKDRGKREVEGYNNNGDYFGDGFPEFPCRKHPTSSSSSGGICAYCLNERLSQLVCPECGEQRIPSCSCSKMFTDPSYSASSTSDIGRISFLLENEKGAEISTSKSRNEPKSSSNYDDYSNLQRSNSIATARSETGKFWKIGKLFRKKREKHNHNHTNNNINQINEENYYECNNNNGVSRSRSVCSFRGFYDTEESGNFPVSSSAARASSVSTGNFVLESAKRSCFSESEARMSNFEYCDTTSAGFIGSNKSNIFSLRETEFVNSEDQAYIDLKLHDISSSSSDYSRVPDLAAMRSGLGLSTKEFGFRGGGDGFGHEMFNNGGRSWIINLQFFSLLNSFSRRILILQFLESEML